MNDPHISYQNVRRVNLPAYKLLIVVAAVIQIVNIQDELTQKTRGVRKAEGKLARSRFLLRAVGGPRKPGADGMEDDPVDEEKEPPSRADTDATAVDGEPIVLTDDDFADEDGSDFGEEHGYGEHVLEEEYMEMDDEALDEADDEAMSP